MVKQLEVSLYRSAPSFEAYSDISTLKHRLQQLAMEIARKTQQAKESGGRSKSRSRNRDHQTSSSGAAQAQQNMGGMTFHSTMPGQEEEDEEERISSQHGNPNDPEWKIRIRHKQQRLLLLHHSSKCPYNDGKCKVTPYCIEMKKLWKHMARCVDNNCRVPHCFSSRSILSHYRKCKDPRCPACGPVRDTVRKTLSSSSKRRPDGMPMDGPMPGGDGQDLNFGIGLGGMGGDFQGDPNMNQMSRGNNQMMNMHEMQHAGMQPSNSPMPYSGEVASMPYGAPQSNNGGGRQSHGGNHAFPESLVNNGGALNGASDSRKRERDPESSKAKHKQQRLLLLRHASKCNVPAGTCTVTPHCAEMKVLWRHIANCKEPHCNIKHCMSSRYVLSHYRKCKDAYCDICGPVRKIIKERTDTYIHDPTFDPPGDNNNMHPPSNMEGPPTKKQKPSHELSEMNGAPPQEEQPAVAPARNAVPTSGEENRAKSKDSKPAQKGAAASEDHSLLECFTLQQIKTHIESLKKTVQVAPAKLKLKCLEVLRGLQTHEHGWVFASPVDPVELNLYDYFDIIKKPMDLGTVQKKLEAGSYHAFGEFKADVRLTFDNAMRYNEEGTLVHNMAKELKKKFDIDYKNLMKQLDKEHSEDSKKAQACGLCGCEKLNFEPPVFFCNGLNCPTKRIRRNTHFYITSDKQYAWCTQCYNELGTEIDLGASKLNKVELNKRKNDETHEESWVQCDDCERWIHQICGLYNTRQDKENKSAYSCPLCLYDKRKKEDPPKEMPPAPSAKDIPTTKLSDWLEKDVVKRVNARLNEIAKEKSETEVSFVTAISFLLHLLRPQAFWLLVVRIYLLRRHTRRLLLAAH
jgi:E1A/CREB-binding protein